MPPAPPTKPRPAKSFQLTIRLEEDVALRADRLLETLTRDRPDLRPFLQGRAAMLRAAILRGLEVYEAEAKLGPLESPAKPKTKGR